MNRFSTLAQAVADAPDDVEFIKALNALLADPDVQTLRENAANAAGDSETVAALKKMHLKASRVTSANLWGRRNAQVAQLARGHK